MVKGLFVNSSGDDIEDDTEEPAPKRRKIIEICKY